MPSVSPLQSCLLCTTWRSGSTHLGSVIETNFGLPFAEEVLWSSEHRKPLAKLLEPERLVQYLEEVVRRKTTADGVFGAKIMWPHLEATLTAVSSLAGWETRPGQEIVAHLFPKPRFVLLTRQDKVRQGISLYRARASNVLHIKKGGEPYLRPTEQVARVMYDRKEIARAIQSLEKSDEGWRRFFERNEISALEIVYEDLCRDLHAVVNRVLDFVGRQRCPADLPLIQRFQVMRDDTTDEWAKRFAQSSRSAC